MVGRGQHGAQRGDPMPRFWHWRKPVSRRARRNGLCLARTLRASRVDAALCGGPRQGGRGSSGSSRAHGRSRSARVSGSGSRAVLRAAGDRCGPRGSCLPRTEARVVHRGFLTCVSSDGPPHGDPEAGDELSTAGSPRPAERAAGSPGPEARPCGCTGFAPSHDAILVGGGTARADDPVAYRARVREWCANPFASWQARASGSSRDLPGSSPTARAEGPLVAGPWCPRNATAISRHAGSGTNGAPELIACARGCLERAAGPEARCCGGSGRARVSRGCSAKAVAALAASLLQADLVDEIVGLHRRALVLGAEGRPSAIGAHGGRRAWCRGGTLPGSLSSPRLSAGDVIHRWVRA